jgi:hypothetical protein
VASLADLLREQPAEDSGRPATLGDLFEEEPVPLSVFVTDRRYLGNPLLSPVQYDAVRHIERVFFPATYQLLAGEASDRRIREYWADPVRMTNFVTLQWGKGGGKDHICRMSSLRVAYLLLCLKSPLDYYGMPEQDTIHMLNVASSSGQAQRAFFTPMTRAVTRGWFSDKADPLQNVIRFAKNLEAISGHSDAESQEGLNLILGIADEIDAFRSQEELERYRGLQARDSTRSAEGILNMLRSSAKAQPLDALVLTPGGWRAMGSLAVGEALVDPEGQPSEVVGVFPQGVKPVYRLTFSDGTSCEATADHLWDVERITRRLSTERMALRRRTVTTADLRGRLLRGVSHPSYLVPAPGLRAQDLDQGGHRPLDPYLLGLLLGDGSMVKGSPSFGSADQQLLDECLSRLPVGVKPVRRRWRTGCWWYDFVGVEGRGLGSSGCNPLITSLRELGLWGGRAWDKRVPESYKWAPADVRLAVLQGLMDTDGWAGSRAGFCSSSEGLRDDVVWLARSLGLTVSTGKPQETAGRLAYRAWVVELSDVRVFRLSRKLRALSVSGRRGSGLRRVVSIEHVRDAECQCIMVSAPSQLYVTDDFTPTHNTRFPEVFKTVRISYPRYLGSAIQVLTRQARKSIAKDPEGSPHYVSGPLRTWDVNPRVQRHCSKHEEYRFDCGGCQQACKAVFQDEYDEDPVMAAAKYECRPSHAINPYFANEAALEACEVKGSDPLEVSYQTQGSTWAPQYRFAPELYPVRGASYAMHADLAVKGDRAGIAMAHVVRWVQVEHLGHDEEQGDVVLNEHRPVVKLDFVISYEADLAAEPPREIQIRWARMLCLELRRRGFNIRSFSFDGFQCQSGSVKVRLLDGTDLKLSELEGAEPFWVYSCTSDGRVVPGLCSRVWRTGYRDDMVEVELDNGERVRCTSDHPWMLRDGSYCHAVDLSPGDSLMPLYTRRESPRGVEYERVWQPGTGRWEWTHKVVSRELGFPAYRGQVIHHGFDGLGSLNNDPRNLTRMTVAEHAQLHANLSKRDPEFRQAQSRRMTLLQGGRTGSETHRYRRDVGFEQVRAAALAVEGQLTWRAVAGLLGCSQDVIYARIRAAGYGSWKEFKWSVRPRSYSAVATARSKERKRAANHKVVAVRESAPEVVYDLQVEEHHNFAISAGVFVHNSVDSMQILETYGIETKKESTDLSEDGWRTLRDLISERRLTMVRRERFHNELIGLSKRPNGRVDHLPGASKDEADAGALACVGALRLGGQEDEGGAMAHPGEDRVVVGEPLPTPEGFSFFGDRGFHDVAPSYVDLSEEAIFNATMDRVFGDS